jgi:hypothetical protein
MGLPQRPHVPTVLAHLVGPHRPGGALAPAPPPVAPVHHHAQRNHRQHRGSGDHNHPDHHLSVPPNRPDSLVPVGRLDRIRPYVEKLLREGFAIPDLAPDDDGDYPFRFRSAGYYVRLTSEESPTLQLFSVVVRDIKRSPKLLARLNEMNAALTFVRVYWLDQRVVVSTELVAQTLDAEELGNACNIVGRAADGIGRTLVAEFGGHVLFEDDDEDAAGHKPAIPAAVSSENAGYL